MRIIVRQRITGDARVRIGVGERSSNRRAPRAGAGLDAMLAMTAVPSFMPNRQGTGSARDTSIHFHIGRERMSTVLCVVFIERKPYFADRT